VSRLSMRKISEILRQRYELNQSYRDIARSLNISTSTVAHYLAHAKVANIHRRNLKDPCLTGSGCRENHEKKVLRCVYCGGNIVIHILMAWDIPGFASCIGDT